MAIWVNLTALCCWEGMRTVFPFTSPLFALNHLSNAYVTPTIATLLWESLSTRKEWTIWKCLPGGTKESGARRKGGRAIVQLGTGKRTAGKTEPSGWLRTRWNHSSSTFSPLTCSLVWPVKVSGEQFLHFFTQLFAYPDKVVPASFLSEEGSRYV